MSLSQTNQSAKQVSSYFQSTKIGSISVQNKLVMAALTRQRADPSNSIPNDLMVEYYTQRAGFGLILTECSQISPLSNAFPGSPGIYTSQQVEGWKKVTQSVHEKGGKIVLQIWHAGRAVLSENIGGAQPLGPSAIPIKTPHLVTKGPHPVPKEMTKEDIKQVVEQFRQGAINAKEAGFDGIQLHSANGYLVDQFLRDGSNKRTDEFGGSIENRSRFLFECIDALVSVFGADKVGVKLSPTGRYNDMYDSNPLELMKYVLKELEKKNIAFVELKRHGEFLDGKRTKPETTQDSFGRTYPDLQIPNFFDAFRPLYNGTLMLNDSITQEEGEELLQKKKGDVISFGCLAISNPDLPERFRNRWEVAQPDYKTFFTGGTLGYADYPTYQQRTKA